MCIVVCISRNNKKYMWYVVLKGISDVYSCFGYFVFLIWKRNMDNKIYVGTCARCSSAAMVVMVSFVGSTQWTWSVVESSGFFVYFCLFLFAVYSMAILYMFFCLFKLILFDFFGFFDNYFLFYFFDSVSFFILNSKIDLF